MCTLIFFVNQSCAPREPLVLAVTSNNSYILEELEVGEIPLRNPITSKMKEVADEPTDATLDQVDFEGLIVADQASSGTLSSTGALYKLPEEVYVETAGQALFALVDSDADLVKLELFSGSHFNSASRIMYAGLGRLQFSLKDSVSENRAKSSEVWFPLQAGLSFSALRFSVLKTDATANWLGIDGLRIAPAPRELTLTGAIPAGAFSRVTNGNIRFNFGALNTVVMLDDHAVPGSFLKITYRLELPGETELPGILQSFPGLRAVSSASPGSMTESWEIRLRPGVHSVFLHKSAVGFLPREIALSGVPAGFSLISFSYGTVSSEPLSATQRSGIHAPEPIPADIGSLLRYPQSEWRQDVFEVFAWSLLPRIVILDFKDLDVQDRFVKRLAFFVEKRGYRGRLLDNAELKGKHGWNANNYSPQGLAAFFNAAEMTHFILNVEEIQLREMCVAWGVLRFENDTYMPGEGGILSVARGGSMNHITRSLLLQHEALHGAFYELAGFRDQSEMEYDNLPAASKEFLIRYFDFMGYDNADSYLMVNELQAYLLQQPIDSLRSYIFRMADRLGRTYPSMARQYENMAAIAYPGLQEAAKRLATTLYSEAGIAVGLMECLVPVQE